MENEFGSRAGFQPGHTESMAEQIFIGNSPGVLVRSPAAPATRIFTVTVLVVLMESSRRQIAAAAEPSPATEAA